MDRTIVYPGSIPLDTDLLATNRNAMVGIAALSAATLGTAPVVDGLAVVPSAQGGLAIDVHPGSLTTQAPLDAAAYGSLPADLNDAIVKTGVNIATVTLPLTAPTTNGYAITYVIQAAFQETDTNAVVLPYYNAANPAQPFLGPNNNGAAQPTLRAQRVALNAKGGLAGPAGANQVPGVDLGWVGLASVTIATGQTGVSAASIVAWAAARTTPFKLPDLRPGFSAAQVFYGSGLFVVPQNVTRLKVTVLGGGGAGGTHATLPSGGGGGGGWATAWLAGVAPGSVIPVTVGAGGQTQLTPQNGPAGGTSAFGIYLAATGGQGGGGGSVLVPPPGGVGGIGFGPGTLAGGGSCGGDGIPIANRGGDGGGPSAGRGATNLAPGLFATGPGGGGGGGGASLPNGAGTGAPGGTGGNGLVLVEY